MGYNIAVFGAFDIDSFGDMLFPRSLEWELKKRIDLNKVILFSPTANKSEYRAEKMIYSYDEFEQVYETYSFHAIIIGGGELLNEESISFKNNAGETISYENGEIWKRPINLGLKYNIKVLVNSVGMSANISEEARELLSKVDYLSFRDKYSAKKYAESYEELNVKVVPDSLWNLEEYYPVINNGDAWKSVQLLTGFEKNEKYVALQLGTLDNYEEIFLTVLEYCNNQNYKLVVFPINWCHDDRYVTEELFLKYGKECIVIKKLLKPEEIIAIITSAHTFVGTSFHGALVSYLSGGKTISYNMYSGFVSKMDGLVAWTESYSNLVDNVRQLKVALYKSNLQNTNIISVIKNCLTKHFDEMADVINSVNFTRQNFINLADCCGVCYDRSFLEYFKNEEIISWKVLIAEKKLDKFCVREYIEINDNEVLWLFPMNDLGKIIIEDLSVELMNELADGYCFDRVTQFKINKSSISEGFKYKKVKYNSTPEFNNLLQLYRNKLAHIAQLEKSERSYISKLSASEQQMALLEKKCAELKEKLSIYEKLAVSKDNELNKINQEKNVLLQTISNKEGHIEQLLEVEREYEREKKSRTYRLASKFRKLSLKLLPINSKRRFFFGMLKKVIRHPRLMLKMINLRRIKNCITILKNEGVSSALHHLQLVEEYEKSRAVSVNNNDLSIVRVSEVEKHIEDYAKLAFPVWESPEVSIVIPVYNQFDYTYHCLESILRNSGDCKYEIIIANDCSTDLTQRIEEIVAGIRVITNEKNLRFLLNCNHAAEMAKGKYILFLNNDTQVQDNWLQPLITLMKEDRTIGMVGSKLIYSDGYLQEAGGILWKDASAWNYGNRQNPNDSEFNYVREVDYISGAAIMIRTSLWEEIGGFDTRFVPAYCEDSDLAFEVRRHGYKVVYQPKSVVVHFEGISNGTDLNSGQKKYQVDNQVKFVEKWREVLEKDHFDNGTNVFLARERSKGKKHVLVIDHYVPQYDKDAGSKTTWMYLKMLTQKGFQITFLGDNFYQHEPYTTELQQMGILVLYGPKYAEGWKEWLRENIQYYDIFYLNRPHISIKYIDFIKEHACGKIIYYGHDLHFLRIQREYEISKNVKLLEESKKWMEQETYLMKKADMSYYPSVVEKNAIHDIDATIPVKAITAYVFEQFEQIDYKFDERCGLLFVGGFGHGPNLDAVLWFLESIYPEVYKRTKAPFYIVGSKAPKEITDIKAEGVIVKGFVSEEELQELYKKSRIAVVPLRYGAGVKGKVVEALYYGIPIVTTSVGAEGISGVEEFVVVKDQEREIIEAICAVYENQDLLADMSAKSQKYVKQYFSVNAVWDIIKDDFE